MPGHSNNNLLGTYTVWSVCLYQSIDVGIYVGIGLSLLLLVKAAGNYSMKPLKTDAATGEFLPVDDLQYQVYACTGLSDP